MSIIGRLCPDVTGKATKRSVVCFFFNYKKILHLRLWISQISQAHKWGTWEKEMDSFQKPLNITVLILPGHKH